MLDYVPDPRGLDLLVEAVVLSAVTDSRTEDVTKQAVRRNAINYLENWASYYISAYCQKVDLDFLREKIQSQRVAYYEFNSVVRRKWPSKKYKRRERKVRPLTAREHQVLELVAQGKKLCEIRDRLGITQGRASHIIKNLYRKMGVAPKDRKGLVRKAIEKGILKEG